MTRPRPREDIRSIERPIAAVRDARVRLDTNESPYPLPEAFSDELAEAVRTLSLHRYPDRDATALRDALARLTGHPHGAIWVGNGSNDVIQHLCLAYGGAGRRALVFEPTYSMHTLIPRIVGMDVVRERLGPGFRLLPDQAAAAAWRHRPDVVFVCSPNNPTGNAQLVAAVQALCDSIDGLVIVDEAYGEFGAVSSSVLLDRFPNIAVVRTLSKAFALAAVRVGYCLGSEPISADLDRVRLPYHLSALTQVAGEVALRHLGDAAGVVASITSERERIARGLAAMPTVEVFPSEANFVMFRTTADAAALWRALLDLGVLVRNVSRTPGAEGCLRVTAGRPEETDAFLDAMREALVEVTV